MRRTPAGMEIDEMKRIVVDSSASLYALDGIDFAAVPLKIVTDEREYLDDGTLDAVEMALSIPATPGKPKAILAHTVKGKGVSFMENQVGWHGKAPNEEQRQQALKELED